MAIRCGKPPLPRRSGSLVPPLAGTGGPGVTAGLLTWSRRSGRAGGGWGRARARPAPYSAGTCGRRAAPPRSAAGLPRPRNACARVCENCPPEPCRGKMAGCLHEFRRGVSSSEEANARQKGWWKARGQGRRNLAVIGSGWRRFCRVFVFCATLSCHFRVPHRL